MRNIVTFACGRDEAALEIQLEPEALLFKVLPGNKISFVGEDDSTSVEWSMQYYQADNIIQLCPGGAFDITIYENGVLLEDWWKYM